MKYFTRICCVHFGVSNWNVRGARMGETGNKKWILIGKTEETWPTSGRNCSSHVIKRRRRYILDWVCMSYFKFHWLAVMDAAMSLLGLQDRGNFLLGWEAIIVWRRRTLLTGVRNTEFNLNFWVTYWNKIHESDVWLTVHSNSLWIRKTN